MQLAFNSLVFYFVMMAVTVTSVEGAGQRYCGEALVQAMAYVCGDRGYFGLTSGIHGRSGRIVYSHFTLNDTAVQWRIRWGEGEGVGWRGHLNPNIAGMSHQGFDMGTCTRY